jgi:subtilisin family serine protease
VGTATVVAASTRSDARTSWSNFGPCVDLYAPGDQITSTWLNGGTRVLSGTSMAAPHVAGVGALYLSSGLTNRRDAAAVDWWIKQNATRGLITGNMADTPNLLLHALNGPFAL